MKRNFYATLFLFILLIPFSSFAGLPYPDQFFWASGTTQDQKVQGPCNCFASVAAGQAWYTMLYGTTVDMAEQHLYSPCAGAGPSTDIYTSMGLMKSSGIVDEASLLYGNSVTDNGSLPYFANNLGTAPFLCTAPHKYNATTQAPNFLYFVGDYTTVSLTTTYPTLGNVDRLKRMLLNYGPLALNLVSHLTGQLHSANTHAYLLYGWKTVGGTTVWYFTDSWPGGSSPITFSGDFIGAIAAGNITLNSGPYYLKPTKDVSGNIVNDGVYQKTTPDNGTTWNKTALTKQALNATVLGTTLGISVNGLASTTLHQYISGTAAALTIENLSQFDNYTVHWSVTADPTTPTANVSFSTPNSATTNVTNAGEGYVNIKATITLSNGVALYISRRIYTNGGIPFKLVKTQDLCGSGARVIKYEIQSRMSEPLPSSVVITTPWNVMPSSGVTWYPYYSSQYIANDVLLIDFYPPTGGGNYGLIVTLHDPAYNNIVDGATTGGSIMYCPHTLMAAKDNKNIGPGHTQISETSLLANNKVGNIGMDYTPLAVYPSPAHTQITVSAPVRVGKTYEMRLADMNGRVLMSRNVSGKQDIDVSKFARGLYMVQFISTDKKEQTVTQKVILQ